MDQVIRRKGKESSLKDIFIHLATGGISCAFPTSVAKNFTNTPKSYTLETYQFLGTSNRTGYLEFGFYGHSSGKKWYLDDVSLINRNLSNAQLIENGGFENGTLMGWETFCQSTCGTGAGAVNNSNPRSGTFSYQDSCNSGFDFLRQSFLIIQGHLYILTFYLDSEGNPQQYAFYRIF